jgi:class 3 adenylate cyclase
MLRRFLDTYQPKPLPALPVRSASREVDRSARTTLNWPYDLAGRLARRGSHTRRLMAALYADLVGYSRLLHQDDAGTVARLRGMHQLVRPAIRWHHGRLVQTAGDSMLVTFESVHEAVQCAVAIQHVLARENDGWPDDSIMRLRVGVDLGDVICDARGFHGSGIVIAVRLQEVCPPGGVCVSRAAHERGGDRLGLPFEPLGTLTLKNVPQPVEAYVLRPLPGARTAELRLVE